MRVKVTSKVSNMHYSQIIYRKPQISRKNIQYVPFKLVMFQSEANFPIAWQENVPYLTLSYL